MKRKNKADMFLGKKFLSPKIDISECLFSVFSAGLSYVGKNGQRHTFMANPYKPSQYTIKTQSQYPYSYSPIIIWGDEKEGGNTQDSDRLYQQNFEETEKLCVAHFGDRGQHFNNRDPKLIEAFLKERLDLLSLKLHMIVEWCNVSSGYPYWSFHFTA